MIATATRGWGGEDFDLAFDAFAMLSQYTAKRVSDMVQPLKGPLILREIGIAKAIP